MVLVTGASGFVGGEIVKQLVENGQHVRIIIRKGSNISHLENIKNKIEIFFADILDIPSLEIALDGIDTIYHSAAIISYNSNEYDAMYKCNVEGTANVINIALAKNIKKLIHISSIAAIGGKPNEIITEDTKWEKNKWTTEYGITKMLAEREIWRGIAEGLEAVIVNPGIIIGVGNDTKSIMRVYKLIAAQKMPFYSNGMNGFVDVKDVVQCSIQLMNSDVTAQRFILVGGNYTFKYYFDTIAKAFNVPPPKFVLNKYVGKIAVFSDWLISKISNKKQNLTNENLKVSLENFEYSNQKIKKQFSYNFIPIEESIETIAQHIKQ